MRLRSLLPLAALLVACLALPACRETAGPTPQPPPPPVAEKIPHELEVHGDVRVDDYYWLRERENPAVIDYLKAENAYTEAVMAHTEELQQTLFDEFKERIAQTDVSVPYRMDDYYYYDRTEEGKDYPIYCRKKGSLEAPEEVMLDVNQLAEGDGFISVGRRAVSYGQDILAYPVDTVGRRIYSVRFKNLTTGEELPDVIENVTSNITWANDDKTLFYTRQDPTTLRWYQIWRHELGTDPAQDVKVYQEDDDTYSCFVYRTKTKRYIMIGCSQTLANEYRFLDADDPTGELTVVEPRQRGHEYEVYHFGDDFYIRTNDGAKNFRLVRTPVERPGRENWQEVIGPRDDVLLSSIEPFRDYLVVVERQGGLLKLRIRPWDGSEEHYLDFGEPAYLAFPTDNFELDTPVLRYQYESLSTPESIYDYDMASREKTLLKREEVGGGFDSADYVTDRLTATAGDGAQVPISIVYRKGTPRDGSHPLLLYGYGSYGYSMDAGFNPYLISLLDRGFVYAIAHIRGGQELGRQWYEDGKLLNKKNTFTDFIDCAQYLVDEGYSRPDRLFALGGSAGGLLMGAVVNMRPDLFHGVVAAVPFVDVVTTMLDESIPLTTSEFDEWGNPADEEYYDYILSYSPYDNVEAKDYPNLLVTTGLHDSQVQYWEPAKWVAKLRQLKTDDHRLLLKTEMEAGHGGVSGRDKRYRQIAFQYAFLLDLAPQVG